MILWGQRIDNMIFIFSVVGLTFCIKNNHEGLRTWIHAHFITTNF